MALGRSKLYDGGAVAEQGDVAAAAVTASVGVRNLQEARQEIDALRSINAHLVRQIQSLRERERQAQRLADRDGLTGLYNRRKMLELLEAALAEAAEQQEGVGLLFIDLDGFKLVNDRHGHAIGDRLLTTVASRIAARARTGDRVCRYGGDEFVVILPRVADMVAVQRVAHSIHQRVALPYRVDGVDLAVTAAIGVAMYPTHARSGTGLLQRADESMYRAKSQWTDPARVDGGSSAPARRRDDTAKRRAPV